MTAQSRHASSKRRNNNTQKIRIIIWFAVITILTVGLWVFIANSAVDTENEALKLSYPQGYSEQVMKASEQYELSPALIYAVIRTESGFEPEAESSVGARGLMQVMPSSFEWIAQQRGESEKYTSDDLFNPDICIDYGCWLLRYFLDYYENEECAVAAYNAGFTVSEWLADSNYSSDGKTLEAIPYPETDNYVDKVESAKKMYTDLYFS